MTYYSNYPDGVTVEMCEAAHDSCEDDHEEDQDEYEYEPDIEDYYDIDSIIDDAMNACGL